MTATTDLVSPRSTLAAWQGRALHTVTCPSGQKLKIRILGLATIIEQGSLPDNLIDIALLELSSQLGAAGEIAADLNPPEGLTEAEVAERRARALERIREFGRLQRHLAVNAIKQIEIDSEWQDIELTLDDLDVLPEDDLAMVAEIVQRLRGQDAAGVRIGVAPLGDFAMFRKTHGCADEGCEGCETLIRELSSSDVGAV